MIVPFNDFICPQWGPILDAHAVETPNWRILKPIKWIPLISHRSTGLWSRLWIIQNYSIQKNRIYEPCMMLWKINCTDAYSIYRTIDCNLLKLCDVIICTKWHRCSKYHLRTLPTVNIFCCIKQHWWSISIILGIDWTSNMLYTLSIKIWKTNEKQDLFTEIYETVLTEIFSYKKYDSFLRKLGVLWFYWKLPGLSITKQL
jgi:hypothetical protein